MKIEEIREIAKEMGLKPGKARNADCVRAIRFAEDNEPCFDRGEKEECGEDSCLWQEDCDRRTESSSSRYRGGYPSC